MAIVRAVKSGNWSDTTVWNTGALPTSADDVYSNTFTVTIDVSPTVLSISNAATTGVTAGGSFVINSGGIVLNANIGSGNTVLTVSNPAFSVSSINGNITSVTGTSNQTINFTGAGILNITGSLSLGNSGGSSNVRAVNLSGSGTLNVTGSCAGGSFGGSNAVGLLISGLGTANITGTCTAGANGDGVTVSAGTANITGICVGGTSATNAGASNQGGTLNHVGTVTASSSGPGIGPGVVGQITTLTGPLISSDGSGGTAAASGVNPCTALRWFPADTALSTFEYRMRGQTVSGSPSVRPARQLFLTNAYDATYPAAGNVRSATTYGPGNIYTGTCAVPSAGSVALGVPVDSTTGTAVLTQENFQAALTAQGLTTARAANLDNLDATISSRLASTDYQEPLDASSTRAALGLASANLDTQFSDLPTATENASAVRSELSTELTRIDTEISSRSTFDPAIDIVAQVTLVDTTTDLTNPPDVPTTSEIADAVRVELTTELDRIDVATSSRLAETDYTTPPTAEEIAVAVEQSILDENDGQAIVEAIVNAIGNQNIDEIALVAAIRADLERNDGILATRLAESDYAIPPTGEENASAVRTELADELARIANAATTQEVAEIVESAMQLPE